MGKFKVKKKKKNEPYPSTLELFVRKTAVPGKTQLSISNSLREEEKKKRGAIALSRMCRVFINLTLGEC